MGISEATNQVKAARISSTNGGLAVPNIRTYYFAIMLSVCLDWRCFISENVITSLEQGTCPLSLKYWLLYSSKIEELKGGNYSVLKLAKL